MPRTGRVANLRRLKQLVNGDALSRIDKRSQLHRRMKQWQADVARDLGGNLSTQQKEMLALAARTRFLLESVDEFLLTTGAIINRRRRCLAPIAAQRAQLAESLAKYLCKLGLERVEKVKTIAEVLAEFNAAPASATHAGAEAELPDDEIDAPEEPAAAIEETK